MRPVPVHVAAARQQLAPEATVELAEHDAELQARLAVVLATERYEHLGGVPAVADRPLVFAAVVAFLLLVPVAMLVAAVHQGPWLWGLLAAAAVAPLPYWLLLLPARAVTVRRLHRSRIRLGAVVLAEPHYREADSDRSAGLLVLVAEGPAGGSAAALLQAATRLRELHAAGSLPNGLATATRGLDRVCGTRLPVPTAVLGEPGLELLRVRQGWALPAPLRGGALLFVLVDPRRHGRGSVRALPELLYGEAGEALVAAAGALP